MAFHANALTVLFWRNLSKSGGIEFYFIHTARFFLLFVTVFRLENIKKFTEINQFLHFNFCKVKNFKLSPNSIGNFSNLFKYVLYSFGYGLIVKCVSDFLLFLFLNFMAMPDFSRFCMRKSKRANNACLRSIDFS